MRTSAVISWIGRGICMLAVDFTRTQSQHSWMCMNAVARTTTSVRLSSHGRRCSVGLQTELEQGRTSCWSLRNWKRHETTWRRSSTSSGNRTKGWPPVWKTQYTVFQRKQPLCFLFITSVNINGFAKFFHHHIYEETLHVSVMVTSTSP